MKSFTRSFVFEYILGNSDSRKWYKFESHINKCIKRDLKEIKNNSEVAVVNKQVLSDYDEPKVIIKGKFDTYWRVYFINKTYSSVLYLTPNGNCFLEDLNTMYNDINNVYQKDTCNNECDYYMSIHYLYPKIEHLTFISDWIKENTERKKDEKENFVLRLK